jgi:hypothetical protein
MVTQQYGNLRQGYNGSETVLNPTEMNNGGPTQPSWSPLRVDPPPSGFNTTTNGVWAQPLYISNMSVTSPATTGNCDDNGGGTCNMLVVVTLAGSVFAFNAGGSSTPGTVIWSRQGSTPSSEGNAGYALWYTDCYPNGSLQDGAGKFELDGIGSTPVVDVKADPPVMYLVSGCAVERPMLTREWWLHQINLKTGQDTANSPVMIQGAVPGSDGADDLNSGSIPFTGYEVYSRSGLLEVTASGTASPLIYVTFGAQVSETDTSYHGWIFGYDNTLSQKVIFATSTQGPSGNSNYPIYSPNCSCSGGLCTPFTNPPPGCASRGTCCIPTTATGAPYDYNSPPNWVGHGGGVWTDGRAPAANTLVNGQGTKESHSYFGVSNGGFQQWQQDDQTPLTSMQNWGESILDFRLWASGFDAGPWEYFTPYGGGPVEPPPGYGTGFSYAFGGLNQNDFDMAASGILLFDDASQNHWLVIFDKAGYGYLLRQGNLCGSSTGCYPGNPSGQLGFVPNDNPSNAFPFAANLVQCTDGEDDDECDRITSVAFNPAGSPPQLIYWPSAEPLTALQLSDNSSQSGSATLTTGGSGPPYTSVTLTTSGQVAQVIPGDSIVVTGQLSQTVTSIGAFSSAGGGNYSQQLIVSPGFTSSLNTSTWTYHGYFIKPIYDMHPISDNVQYPGGAVEVTSSGDDADTLIWGLANVGSSSPGTGALFAYDSSLSLQWCTMPSCTTSPSTFTIGQNNAPGGPSGKNTAFGLPTIVNGYIYIPTNGITINGSQVSGVVVYSGN